jgi:hypothetical protein
VSGWLPRERRERVAAILGVVALLVFYALARKSPVQAMLSYLAAFVFLTGLSVGALALVMVHSLTGGSWGDALRRQWLAAGGVLPLQALLMVPILLQRHLLFPWDRSGAVAQDSQLRAQSWYLNDSFFLLRAGCYFGVWLGLWVLLLRAADHPERVQALPRVAAAGLILYALSTLLASTDWLMSLVPHWHSTTFGMMVATGWMLGAASLAILHGCASTEGTAPLTKKLLRDFGNLLLMFVLAWWYLAFMQYLTIWVADLPAETVWYLPRTLTSWRELAWLQVVIYFTLPFVVLLSRQAKRYRAWLATVAGVLLFGNLLDAFWLVVPSFRPAGFELFWTDGLAAVGMGALWLCVFWGRWRARPAAAARPNVPTRLEHAGG